MDWKVKPKMLTPPEKMREEILKSV